MNILFLAYEVESNAIAELSDHYSKKGHNCFILNCDFWTFYSNKNFYNIYDQKCDAFYNLEEEYQILDKTKSRDEVDYEYLSQYEEKYNFKFNDLIRSDPILYTATHDRDYYNIPSDFIKHKWIELLSRKLEKICLENQIEKAVTINNNYFIKNLGNKIFPTLNIEYLSILGTRIDDHYMVYDNFGLGSPNSITDDINKPNNNFIDEAQEIIDSVVSKGQPAYKTHMDLVNKYNSRNLVKDFVESINYSIFLIRAIFSNFYKNRSFKNKYFAPRPFKELFMPFRNDIFRKFFLEKSKVLKKEIPDEISYYYYGLHYHPESSLLTYSKFHDESEWILKICADLDINTYLVVKENMSMMGQRDPSFYKKLSLIPNLIILHPSVDNIKLIKNSLGVIGLAGTILIEAAMFNKPSYVIATPEYLALSYVNNYSRKNLNTFRKDKVDNNIKKYIQLILSKGIKLDMTHILYGPYRSAFKYDVWRNEVLRITSILDKRIK